MASHDLHNWEFVQSYGDDNSSADDHVTAMKYNDNGEFLALGDRAGRICVFQGLPEEPEEEVKEKSIRFSEETKFCIEFLSHSPEFDVLKSQEIEPTINCLEWAGKSPTGSMILSASAKTIKMWKISERKQKRIVYPSSYTKGDLIVPRVEEDESEVMYYTKRVFSNVSVQNIQSISLMCGNEIFLSADEFRVNLWNLNSSEDPHPIVSLADNPEAVERLTCATFHPTEGSVFVYSTDLGKVLLGDLRHASTAHATSRAYESPLPTITSNLSLQYLLKSVSDCKFTDDGRYIYARDYQNLKIWDVKMERQPLRSIPVHQFLDPYLEELVENEYIFDRFNASASPDSKRFITGSYNNHFMLYDITTDESITVAALTEPQLMYEGSVYPDVDQMDFRKKALNVGWHPCKEGIALAGGSQVCIYRNLS